MERRTVNIAERAAEGIRSGLRPDAAILAACKAAGRLETKEWLRNALPESRWPATRWALARHAEEVTQILLARAEAWEAVEARHIRVGDFVTFDEDALVSITGRDRNGNPAEESNPHDMHWASVIADGYRVDQRTPAHGGYLEVLEVDRCRCCGHVKEEEARGDVIYAFTPVLRLRSLGPHAI